MQIDAGKATFSLVCPPSYKFFDSVIPVPSDFDPLKPLPSFSSVSASLPVEFRRAFKSVVDVLLPMDLRKQPSFAAPPKLH